MTYCSYSCDLPLASCSFQDRIFCTHIPSRCPGNSQEVRLFYVPTRPIQSQYSCASAALGKNFQILRPFLSANTGNFLGGFLKKTSAPLFTIIHLKLQKSISSSRPNTDGENHRFDMFFEQVKMTKAALKLH